jgi:hypothetical protein
MLPDYIQVRREWIQQKTSQMLLMGKAALSKRANEESVLKAQDLIGLHV